jgi:CRISPR/Cas system-associated exonuclease Cas4 (RecB family)
MGNTGKHNDYYLQAILYSCIIRRSKQYNSAQLPVSPALLFIQHSATDNYDPTLYLGKDRIDDVDIYQQRFGELLIEKVNEIFNPDIAFYPIKDLQQCQTCPYYLICSQHK